MDKTSLLLGIGNVVYIKIMTEREKMLAGEIYDCGDEQLIERWHLAKQLQKKYSETDSRYRDRFKISLHLSDTITVGYVLIFRYPFPFE